MTTTYKMKSHALAAAVSLILGLISQSCTDEIKFGDSFIEKAPGGEATMEDIASNAEYAEQWANGLYCLQYYGLPYNSGSYGGGSASMYRGKLDAVTDLYQMHWSSTTIWNAYYLGSLDATQTPLIGFTDEQMWELVRRAYQLLEVIDNVPGMDESKRVRIKAETKCLLAAKYFDMFINYGGLPIIDHYFSGSESSYELKRATLNETVEHIVGLLDEAIPDLPWAYNGTTTSDDELNNRARWSRAGALALKAKVLTFAASPLFNPEDGKAPYDGSSQAEQDLLVWYGDYQVSRWTRALEACKEFFKQLEANGFYALEQASGTSVESYRLAYRKGYIYQTSHEPLHTTRVRDYDNWSNGYYNWSNWINIGRNSYLPTFEYMEMFPWSDGSKFDWEEQQSKINGVISPITGELGSGQLFYRYLASGAARATRDPRLYENIVVNGMYTGLDMTTASTSGDLYELWAGGYHEGNQVVNDKEEIVETLTSKYSTGFGVMKYQCGTEYQRLPLQWVYLGLDEMYLMYAECLAQTGDLSGAIEQLNIIRNRVGLTISIADVYPEIKTDKNAFIDQLLRERACELGMSNNRYYDMVRYKRSDWMTKRLHGLIVWRLQQDAQTGEYVHNNTPWYGDQKNNGTPQPNRFAYTVFPLQQPAEGRALWAYESDPNALFVKKWFFSPFPQAEIIKGYGLVQNPGW